jgi:outer membrane protein assembly factor BamB
MTKSISKCFSAVLFILLLCICANGKPIPWPMLANDAGGTGYSPTEPLTNPWVVPVAWEETLEQKLGLGLNMASGSTGNFLLIGPDDILLFPVLSYRETEKGGGIGGEHRYLVGYDPEGAIAPWYQPIPPRTNLGGPIPAIGTDGTVYAYDEEGELIGIDIRSGEIVWKPKCEELLPAPWNAYCRQDYQLPLSGSLLLSETGDLITNYKYLFNIRLSPNHKVRGLSLNSGEVEEKAWTGSLARAVDSSGNLYLFVAQWKKDSSKTFSPLDSAVIALSPELKERWRSEIPGLKHGPDTSDVSVVAGADSVFILASGEGRTIMVACLDSSTGVIKWQKTLSCTSAGYSSPVLSRPILGPDSLDSFYVLHPTNEGLKLSSLNTKDGSLNWERTLSETFDPRESYQTLMAGETICVETDMGLLQVNGWSGEVCPCVIPVDDIRSMAIGEDGELYLIGRSSGVDLMRTVPNSPPVITSVEPEIRKYDEDDNKVRVSYHIELRDPLGWNRNLVGTITYGNGKTEEDRILFRDPEPGDLSTARQKSITLSHSYALDDLQEELIHPTYELSVEHCDSCSVSKSSSVCLGAPTIGTIYVLPGDNVYVDEEISFKARAQPPVCGPAELTYTWDFDEYDETATGSVVRYIYSRTGQFEVSVTVGVEGTPFTTTQTKIVTVSRVPRISIEKTPIRYTTNGLEYRFNYQLRGDLLQGKEPLEVRWDFGDGENLTTTGNDGVLHAFKQPGDYHVKATVTFAEDVSGEGKAYVHYNDLPKMDVGVLPKSPYNHQEIEVVCQPRNQDDVIDGLTYQWVLDDTPLADHEEVTIDGPVVSDLEFVKPGRHSIECLVKDPNPDSKLTRKTHKSFRIRDFPFPEPNGSSIPFLQDPGIPSGSTCRGACGGGCPDTCTDRNDINLLVKDPEDQAGYYLVTYEGVIICGTHAGCRWHDWCFDRCVEVYGETDVVSGRCHTVCNARAEYYGTIATSGINGPLSVLTAWNWKEGGGPFDYYWQFARDISLKKLDDEALSNNDFPLYPDDFAVNRYGLATYELVFYTGQELGAGTDAKISLELKGEINGEPTSSGTFAFDAPKLPSDALDYLSDNEIAQGMFDLLGIDDLVDTGTAIGNLVLDNQVFESGSVDSFFVTGYEVGDLTQVVLGHDNSGAFADWYLDKITVIDTRSRRTWTVNVNQWLNEDSDTLSISTTDIQEESICFGSTIYFIEIRTKFDIGAGTDSNIFLELIGDCGGLDTTSGALYLDNFYNNFEMGDLDLFLVPAKEIGELTSVKLYHDGSGIGSAWDCDYIRVTNLIGDRTWRIEVDEELDNETITIGASSISEESD